jgi:FMN phosphatase YigB (HAD superfamily)
MRRPYAITLDLDDTILDGAGLEETIELVCRSLANIYSVDAKDLKAANAEAFTEIWTEAGNDWVLGKLESDSLSLEAWRRALVTCGVADEAAAGRALDLHSQFSPSSFRLFGDVQELLDFVAEEKIPLGLITNGASDVQREKLAILGLESWFEIIVVSGELAAAKPSSLPFEVAVGASLSTVLASGMSVTTSSRMSKGPELQVWYPSGSIAVDGLALTPTPNRILRSSPCWNSWI